MQIIKVSSFVVGLSVVGVVIAGCSSADEPRPEDATTESAPKSSEATSPEGNVSSTSQALNGAGQTCVGMCYTGLGYGCGWYWEFPWPAVTQDCRANVVNLCHQNGYSFYDARWTSNPPPNHNVCIYRT